MDSGNFDIFNGCTLQFDCGAAERSSQVLWQRAAVFSSFGLCLFCGMCVTPSQEVRDRRTYKNWGKKMDGCLELDIYFIFAFYSTNAIQKNLRRIQPKWFSTTFRMLKRLQPWLWRAANYCAHFCLKMYIHTYTVNPEFFSPKTSSTRGFSMYSQF